MDVSVAPFASAVPGLWRQEKARRDLLLLGFTAIVLLAAVHYLDLDSLVDRWPKNHHWFGIGLNEFVFVAGVLSVGFAIFSLRRWRDLGEEVAAHNRADQQYRQLVEQSADGIVIIDGQGNVVFGNQAVREMLGYSPAEFLQLTTEDTYLPEERALSTERRQHLQIGGTAQFERNVRRKDGSWFPAENTLRRVENDRYLVMVRDITARRHAEQTRLQLAAIIESSNDAIIGKDLDGIITSWNAAAEKLYGYAAAEAIGRSIQLIVPADRPQEWQEILDKARRGEHVSHFETQRIAKSGSRIDISVSVFPVKDASGTIIGAAAVARDVTERKQAEEIRLQLAAIVESSEDAIFATNLDGTITTWNEAAERLFGYSARQATSQSVQMIITPDHSQEKQEILRKIARGERINQLETVCMTREGKRVDVSISVSPVKDASGRIVGTSTIARDTSDRKRLREQLLQAQKVEAIGRLAGGVAHDFNNILTTIIGYCDLTREQLSVDHETRANIEEIAAAAERAASLTRQLLAFSRKQTLQPKILDLNAVIGNLDKMLRRLIGEDVDLITKLMPNLGRVKADPGQIEQVITNLAVNARDAMPNGGKLLIETANVALDAETARLPEDMRPGDYVMIAVTDTGSGMTDEVKAHLFEPFFTTKPQGHGTGLGLSTCYGIVKQSGGCVNVYSEPGHGTTFKIYLPFIPVPAAAGSSAQSPVPPQAGKETILLVEDDLSVRGLNARLLRSRGYNILEAGNGQEALRVAEQHTPGEIALLLTDVIMPEMGGKELAQHFRAAYPDAKVLFCSGYTQEAIDRGGELEPGIAFLQKPFTPASLSHKIREVLDQ
jgi:PAS domain S-box-containing protein